MKQDYWEQFTMTGRVDDYLYYKGMGICRDVMDKYAEADRASCADRTLCTDKDLDGSSAGAREGEYRNVDRNGDRYSESVDNGDGNDPVGITYRRI